jgi:hypothetical protein
MEVLPDIIAPAVKTENIYIPNGKMKAALALLPHQDDFIFRNINGRYINFTRIRASYCDLCNRVHEKDNTLYIKVDDKGDAYKSCNRGCKSIKLGNVGFNAAMDALNCILSLTPDNYETDSDYSLEECTFDDIYDDIMQSS